MADIGRYTGYGVNFEGSMVPSIVDGSPKLNPNVEKLIERYDGDIEPTLIALLTNEPLGEFQTRDVSFLSAAAAFSTSPVIFYFKAYDEVAGMGASGISFSAAKGIIVPTRLQGQSGKDATLTCEVHAVSSDGDTNPITTGTSVASSTAHGDAYTIGDVSLGSDISGVQEIDFNFGYTVKKNTGENGKPFPTLAYIEKREATLKIKAAALGEASSLRINTTQSVTSSLSFIFRKLSEAGVPSGTLTGTIAKAIIEVEAVNAGRPATVDLMATLAKSSSNYLSWSAI